MSNLLRKRNFVQLDSGVTVIQDVTTENAPLIYTECKILDLDKDAFYRENLGKKEVCIVVLTGKISVSDGETSFNEIGKRKDIFEKIPTDSVYISNDREIEVKAESPAKISLVYAPSTNQLPTKLIEAKDNRIEERGKYSNKRKVHNILPDDDLSANSLLVVEVYTDSGNWSSYPPHKHDENNLPNESLLEEIYYHEQNPNHGFVFQRVYTEDRSIDETMTVEHRDAVIVPKGYHPVGVPDGYDSYYLNVMAGPIRKWEFHNEKAHEWIIDRK